ncbi:alpha/beta hydrolase [Curtobacterium sp. VKM Ac-1376]|uniref:alpha/beta hydrolase n=1 Tax=Curtobacterium sp. VKM Ac-1376 TaxID=123312 RepID=UPI00188AEC39|nr:alpha/beta hydrolase [Curtobacterium sp. VKM Ac-1376]MBF4614227.1 alpha/beta hydrolase [Curtobacterium sp. VKM Ac-1376]
MRTPDGITVRPSSRGGSRPAVIVLPGGGYEEHGRASSEPMAEWFAAAGLHAFLFRYPLRAPGTVGPLHPAPVDATRRVFAWLRSGEATEDTGLAIDVDRVGVAGSSAGGHLAASLANGIDDPALDRPAFCVLSYPVVTMEHPTRARPLVGLLGDAPTWRQRRELSMETRVDGRTPPTFVWTTADDRIVRASNALSYADALVRNEVDVEVHVFPHGRHGLGTAVTEPHTSQWTRLCENWLRYQRVLTD